MPLQRPPVKGRVLGNFLTFFTEQHWVVAWQQFHLRHVQSLELHCMPCIQERQKRVRPASEVWQQNETDAVAAA